MKLLCLVCKNYHNKGWDIPCLKGYDPLPRTSCFDFLEKEKRAKGRPKLRVGGRFQIQEELSKCPYDGLDCAIFPEGCDSCRTGKIYQKKYARLLRRKV